MTESDVLDTDETTFGESAAAYGSVAPAADARTAAPKVRRPRRAPGSETRIADEAAFVLHGYPYKETSLIVDVLTRRHGRVALVARGAKRPRSALRGVLLAFQPLSLAWIQSRVRAATGGQGGDLRTLTRAEWLGGLRPLRGEALLSGFYLNELIQKLVARDDPHEGLFDAYFEALGALAAERPASAILRRFEAALLRETGYALHGDRSVDGDAIDPAALYRYQPDRGPVRVDRGTEGRVDTRDDAIVVGKTLLDIDRDDYADPFTLVQAKRLMRFLLQHHLAGQVLHTRRLLMDLQAFDEAPAR